MAGLYCLSIYIRDRRKGCLVFHNVPNQNRLLKCSGADLPYNHPAHAPLFALICKTKKMPPVQPDNLYSCAPGSIFSGPAPDVDISTLLIM